MKANKFHKILLVHVHVHIQGEKYKECPPWCFIYGVMCCAPLMYQHVSSISAETDRQPSILSNTYTSVYH